MQGCNAGAWKSDRPVVGHGAVWARLGVIGWVRYEVVLSTESSARRNVDVLENLGGESQILAKHHSASPQVHSLLFEGL
jgi:hypothetical protein